MVTICHSVILGTEVPPLGSVGQAAGNAWPTLFCPRARSGSKPIRGPAVAAKDLSSPSRSSSPPAPCGNTHTAAPAARLGWSGARSSPALFRGAQRTVRPTNSYAMKKLHDSLAPQCDSIGSANSAGQRLGQGGGRFSQNGPSGVKYSDEFAAQKAGRDPSLRPFLF